MADALDAWVDEVTELAKELVTAVNQLKARVAALERCDCHAPNCTAVHLNGPTKQPTQRSLLRETESR